VDIFGVVEAVRAAVWNGVVVDVGRQAA